MRLTVDGKTVFVSTGSGHPDADAASVVFVHGAGFDHTIWVMPARYFARHGMRVLAVDLPGHGRSDGPAHTSIETLADWLAGVLDAAEVREAAIVGHSMGSLIGYRFAQCHAARCRTLTLLGPAIPLQVTHQLLDAAEDNDHAAIDMANAWSHSPRGKLGANDNPGVWMLGTGERLIERSAPGVFHADLAACNDYQPTEQLVEAPTLLILGDADQMTPARRGLALAEKLPHARVVRLAGCGHSMLSEAPNQVLDALISNV